MPQLQLPIFPEGMTMINANLGVMTQDGTVTYIYGRLPIFSHAVDEVKTFRMITSQLYINGSAGQAEICRAFGVSRISVKRSVKLYREKGIAYPPYTNFSRGRCLTHIDTEGNPAGVALLY